MVYLVSGKARSGKDTFAHELIQVGAEAGKVGVIIHVADYLKYLATTYFNWNGDKDEAGRSLLQGLGTEGRSLDDDYWINITVSAIQLLAKTFDFVVIPDIRYKNEIYVPEEFFDTCSIRIEGNIDNGLTADQLQHASEIDVDDYGRWDFIVHNDGTFGDLRAEAKRIFELNS
jgi:hypothetical protein